MTDFPALIRLLIESKVEFIIVGGAAATAHGSGLWTDFSVMSYDSWAGS